MYHSAVLLNTGAAHIKLMFELNKNHELVYVNSSKSQSLNFECFLKKFLCLSVDILLDNKLTLFFMYYLQTLCFLNSSIIKNT